MTKNISDEDLLYGLKVSAPESRLYFETLYQRYAAKIKRYLSSKNLNPEQAEDLCQQVFIKIFEKRERYRIDTPAQAWIFIIARSLFLDWMRSQKRQYTLNSDFFDYMESQKQTPQSYTEDMNTTFDLALNNSDLQLLQARYQEGLTYQELAVKFGQSAVSLRKKISRLYKSLRKKPFKVDLP